MEPPRTVPPDGASLDAATARAPVVEWNLAALPRVADADHGLIDRAGRLKIRRRPLTGTAVRFHDGESVELLGYAGGVPSPIRGVGPLRLGPEPFPTVYRADRVTMAFVEPFGPDPDDLALYDGREITGVVADFDTGGEARTLAHVRDGTCVERVRYGHAHLPSEYWRTAKGGSLALEWKDDGTVLTYRESDGRVAGRLWRQPDGRLQTLYLEAPLDRCRDRPSVNRALPALRETGQLRRLPLARELTL